MSPFHKILATSAMLLCCSHLSAQEQNETGQLWQAYADLGMFDRLITELETEIRKGDSAREPELTRTLLTHWDTLMKQRRWCDVRSHWDGDGAYGFIGYRTKDMPSEMVQHLHAYRTQAEEFSEEEHNQIVALLVQMKDYIDRAPDAEKIDELIQLIYREEYPKAIKQLAQLLQEHPDYHPQAFSELASALATPNRLELLLLCTKLPLGVIRETHLVE